MNQFSEKKKRKKRCHQLKILLVWPERRPAQESWGSHRRRQRSWEPVPGGWGVWAASPSYWCQTHPGRHPESWLSCL